MASRSFADLRKETHVLKRALKKVGLPTDIGEAIAALASTIRDHKHFETLLTEMGPEDRADFYEACRPHLKFTAWPLDRYVASAGTMAEREQLPTIGDNGKLQAFRSAADVKTLEEQARAEKAAYLAKRTLILVCGICGQEGTFVGSEAETPADVVVRARNAGWIYDYISYPKREICPKCPTSLRTNG